LIALASFSACHHEGGGPGDGSVPSDGATAPGPGVDASSPHDGALADGAIVPGDDGGGSCGACDTPPAGGCYGATGACQSGHCVYPIVAGATCDDGNACTVADTCNASGQCVGTALGCTTPPGAVCLSGSSLRTYDASGSCNAGVCVYTSHDSTCTTSCVGGACANNACATITCNMPPSSCYAPTGTCDAGSCSYAYADGSSCDDGNACTTQDSCDTGTCVGVPVSCNTPPASTCKDASTAQIYAAQGSCSAGSCSYTYGYQSCAAGCSNGVCNASGWKLMNANTTAGFVTVWGASASAVWAGGYGPTFDFYNGIAWEVVPTGVTDGSYPLQIHGTSASNVFAIMSNAKLMHYDGTSWTTLSTVLGPYLDEATIAVIGNNDLFVTGTTSANPNATPYETGNHTLTRVTNGVASTVTTWTDNFLNESFLSSRMWAFSASDAYLPGLPAFHWNGTTMTPIGSTAVLQSRVAHIWGASDAAVYSDWDGVSLLNSSGWSALNPPTNDLAVNDLSGTAANRVFAVGGDAEFDGDSDGIVFVYDGVGWTTPTMPANLPSLFAVWAVASGQVFAVGPNGTILTGP
jgi:hypothetical protein